MNTAYNSNNLLLTESEAAKILAISPRKLFSIRKKGDIPFLKLDRLVRYHKNDLEEWINSKRQTYTPDLN